MPTLLVTGATRGIGLAIARLAIAEGSNVVGVARDEARLAELALEYGDAFVPLVADLSDAASRASLVADVLALSELPDEFVSSAGFADYLTALDTDAEMLRAHFEVHVVAGFELARALSAAWLARGSGGSMVFVSSTLSTRPAPLTLAYAIAKSGVDAMVRGLALELAPHAIRVNGVAPGVVETEMVRTHRPDGFDDADARLAGLARLHPIGRLGRPEEIAETVLHVLHAPFMTGSSVVLDGGLSL